MRLPRLRRLLAPPLRGLLALAGRAYVPGPTLDDALRRAQRHAAEGRACTLGYFNPPDEPPAAVAAQDAAIADAVAALQPRGYVSIKAPALRYDPAALDAVLERCRERGVRAHFDSHDFGNAEPTLACVNHAVDKGIATGLTLPGRWRRSLEDAAFACALGVRVRVVKGEWPDPAAPAADARAGCLAVVDTLIAHGAREVAIASHDPELAAEALRRLQAAGASCELELLHGLPRRALLALARARGVAVRMYLPFGVAWRPYALAQARRRPRIVLWLLKDLVVGLLRRGGR